mmetsp:Transcript_4940/g.12040  ORF Transcript_4940/g.12040 Transcript_4940/m.12040 type:complete len:168 (-) Transcript_4940:40-543(-)
MSTPAQASAQVLRRTDVKAFFANERTFLHWLSTSVTLGTISSALAGVVGHTKFSLSQDGERIFAVQAIATGLVLVSILMAVIATANFYVRGRYLTLKVDGPYYSRILPIVVTSMMTIAMGIVFVGSVVSYFGSKGEAPAEPPSPTPPPQPAHLSSAFSQAPPSLSTL